VRSPRSTVVVTMRQRSRGPTLRPPGPMPTVESFRRNSCPCSCSVPAALTAGTIRRTRIAARARREDETYFSFRVDMWDEAGDSIVEHVAGIDDFETSDGHLLGPPSNDGRRRGSRCARARGQGQGQRALRSSTPRAVRSGKANRPNLNRITVVRASGSSSG
jgi:hypothetical protein